MIFQRARAAACVALLALAFSPAGAATAAPAGWDACPVDHFCVWEGADGGGRIIYFRHGSKDVRKQGFAEGAQSAWNRTGVTWCTYYKNIYWPPGFEVNANVRVNQTIHSLKKC